MPTATAALRTAPIGSGVLHNALEEARDRAQLQAFCRGVGCASAEVSADGIHIDMLRVLDAMRQRGYQASEPKRSPHQPRRNFTAWLVNLTLPENGPSCQLGFYTPNTS